MVQVLQSRMLLRPDLLEAVVQDPDGLPLVLVEVPVTHPLRRRRS